MANENEFVYPILTGRAVIETAYDHIDRTNIIEILGKAIGIHQTNQAQETYLYNYYCGKQPILQREKVYNKEINNKVVENRAYEIVSFKSGYLMGEPIQYINRSGREELKDDINRLNDYCFIEDKASKDKELADWFSIVGTSYRLVLPNPKYTEGSKDESPFIIDTPDPRNAFVIYHSGHDHRPLAGALVSTDPVSGSIIYTVYTDSECITVGNGTAINKVEPHLFGMIPLIEYPANKPRIGDFEVVIRLLDAINDVESGRIDAIDNFVQAILMFKGVDVESEAIAAIKDLGAMCVPADGDVKYITQELNQEQTQTLVNYMYQAVLTIVGMPNRNGGTSTSDTGSAVILRDGWSSAEARAKDSELMFKPSEKAFLRLAMRITNFVNVREPLDLGLADIEIRFTRRNYENIQMKAQVLLQMLSTEKIHPKLAFDHCGMFSDPTLAYTMSMDNYERIQREEEALLKDESRETEEPAAEEPSAEE